tara:strand:+ start:3776 stop:4270 length:495 start_codon:yes stop_codon:yes gene_type:complete
MDDRLRRMSPGDREVLRRVRLAALADAPRAFCGIYDVEAEWGAERWDARLASNVARVETAGFFAMSGGRECGMVVGVCRPEDAVDLNAMWVAPAARGLGVGRALVAAVCGWAEELGRTRVTLSVLDGNPAAEALYRRCGFRVVESRAVEVAGEARTETHMERAV